MWTRLAAMILIAPLAVAACGHSTEPAPAPATPSFRGLIVFQSDRVLRWQLFAIHPDGSELTQLTSTGRTVGRPSQSPDGQTLAFSMGGRVWLLPAGSLQPEPFTRILNAVDPQWAPDGSGFVYYSNANLAGTLQVYRLSMFGDSTSRLTGGAAANRFPVWSPDSKYIVFTSFDRSVRPNFRTVRYEMATGVQEALAVDASFDDHYPVYSPSGRWIAFVREQLGTTESRLAIMRADGTDVRILDHPTNPIQVGSWSPDETRLVVTLGPPENALVLVDIANGTIDTLLADGHSNRFPLWVR